MYSNNPSSTYKPISHLNKWLMENIFFPHLKQIKPVDSVNLGKVGFKTTAPISESEKLKKLVFHGEGASKAWFENSPDGIGYFNQELYNKIKDYHKNT
jgi:hypothetical protein